MVIVNPTAGSGRAGRLEGELRERLSAAGIEHRVDLTQRPRHAEELARLAVAEGYDALGVVGGDGTLNEVIHGYLDRAGRPVKGPALCLIPAGTGGDFRKTFSWSERTSEGIERLISARRQPLDLGVVEVTRLDGTRERRAFVNILSFGVGGLTDQLVNAGPKWIGGKAAFLWGAFRATLAYRPVPVEVRVDGEERFVGPIVNVAIANGRFFGGGMKVAPDADPKDGLFDVVAITDRTTLESVALAPHMYRGTHVSQTGVISLRGRRIEARATRPDAEVLVDLDGEMPGRLPLTAEIVPGALELLV
jgi:YegS/Rv2252/BmrU family lipid kinase